MADPEDQSPTGDAASSDDGTVKDAPDTMGVVAQLVEQELQDHPTPLELGSGPLTHRYREILREQEDDSSELSSVAASSVDALPKRVGSPIDSVMSGPDDTPSIQVHHIETRLETKLIRCRARSYRLLEAVSSRPLPLDLV